MPQHNNNVQKSSRTNIHATSLNKPLRTIDALVDIQEASKSKYLIMAVKKLIDVSEKYKDSIVDDCIVNVIKNRIEDDQKRCSKETQKQINAIIQNAKQGEITHDVALKKIKSAINQLDSNQKTKINELQKFIGNFLLNNNSYAFEMAEKIWHFLQEEKQKENIFKGMNDNLFKKNLNFLFDENTIL